MTTFLTVVGVVAHVWIVLPVQWFTQAHNQFKHQEEA